MEQVQTEIKSNAKSRTSVTMTPELFTAVKLAAASKDTSVSAIIEQALRDYLLSGK